MNKRTKIMAAALSTVLMVSTFAGCGSSNSSSSNSSEKLPTGQTITIWSHLNDDEIAAARTKAEEWGKKTNNTVKVIKDNGKFEALVTAAKSPSGPDMVFGTPHDHLGQFVTANVAAEIPSGTIDESKFTSASLEACKYNGKTYGVPVVTETYALFYNKDMVKDSEVPKTWDDLLTLGKKVGFEYDINNFYFSYALLAGNGAYVFKDNNGKYDASDIGLGGQEATAGLQMLKDLVDKGLMKASMTGDIAKGDFSAKKIGLYISGPWDVGGDKGFKTLGLNFGVAPLPQINGKATPSFMGVQVAVVNPNTKNKALVYDCLKYLEANALDNVVKCGRLPVTKDSKALDPSESGFAEQVKNAQPMPNIPEMAAVWTPAGDTLKSVTNGKLSPADGAKTMLDNIKKGIAATK